MAYNWRKAKSKNNIDVYNNFGGMDRRSELMAESDTHTNYFPKGIEIEDIDRECFNLFMNGELSFNVEGEKVKSIIMSKERWAEFEQTWSMMDDDGNVPMPYVTIRRSDVKRGTYLDVEYSIPNRKTFPYLTVPTYKDGIHGFDKYMIPQPIPIDIYYEITFFTRYMGDVNRFYTRYLTSYSNQQLYVNVNGHFMPTTMEEDFSEEDTMDDIEGDRFYKKSITIICKGYLQDEKEYKKVEAINRVGLIMEIDNKIVSQTTIPIKDKDNQIDTN